MDAWTGHGAVGASDDEAMYPGYAMLLTLGSAFRDDGGEAGGSRRFRMTVRMRGNFKSAGYFCRSARRLAQ